MGFEPGLSGSVTLLSNVRRRLGALQPASRPARLAAARVPNTAYFTELGTGIRVTAGIPFNASQPPRPFPGARGWVRDCLLGLRLGV